jgi:hypothetical protein
VSVDEVSAATLQRAKQAAEVAQASPEPAQASGKGMRMAVAAILLLTVGVGGVFAMRGGWFSPEEKRAASAVALADEVADSDSAPGEGGGDGVSEAQLAELERLRLLSAERRAREAELAQQDDELAGSKPIEPPNVEPTAAEATVESDPVVQLYADRSEVNVDELDPAFTDTLSNVTPSSSESVVALQSGGTKVAAVTPSRVPTTQVKQKPSASAAVVPLHGVIVIAIGDPAVARPLESLLSSALNDESIPVMDTEMMSGLGNYVGVDSVDLPGLTDFSQSQGAAAVLLARVDHLGEQFIQAYGTGAQLNTALVSVKAYDVARKRSVGPAMEEQINYTGMTAREQASEAVTPMMDDLSDQLAAYR